MQNKSNLAKSHYITPSSRYYRSVKYNITQTTGFNPNSTSYIDYNRSSINNTSKTYAPAWKKPTSFSQHKSKNTRLT